MEKEEEIKGKELSGQGKKSEHPKDTNLFWPTLKSEDRYSQPHS